MQHRHREIAASIAIVGIFLCVQLGAVMVAGPFEAAGLQPDVDHQNPINSLVYIAAIIVATVLMLAAIRFEVEGLIRVLVVFSGAYIALFVFQIIVPPAITISGIHLLAWLGAAGLGIALYLYPEWYVIDAAGIVMGIGAAGLFGITFGVLPALVLLIVLAVYDAISVYGTRHMLTLASGVMELRVPIVLVVPLSLGYSFREAKLPDPTAESEESPDESTEGRDALFIGLGDAVIPSVLVASAAFFAPASIPVVGTGLLAMPVPAATAIVGTMAGLSVLMWMVLKGRPHAGLPLLNGGAIAGYLLGALWAGMSLQAAIGLAP